MVRFSEFFILLFYTSINIMKKLELLMIKERDPSLKGLFDILYQSIGPSSKNSSIEISLKEK